MDDLITAILLEAMFQIWKRPEITKIGFLAWVESLPVYGRESKEAAE